MLAKSNCESDYISNWETQDIENNLKNWFKSIEVVKNNNKSLQFNNKNYVKCICVALRLTLKYLPVLHDGSVVYPFAAQV